MGINNPDPLDTKTDEQLRQDIYNRWNSSSIGTLEYIAQLARHLDENISDIKVVRNITRSIAYLFCIYEGGQQLTSIQRQALQDAMNDDSDLLTKVIWWDYSVLPALRIPYEITGNIVYSEGITATEVQEWVEAVLAAEVTRLQCLGIEINTSRLEHILYDNAYIIHADLSLAITDTASPNEWRGGTTPLSTGVVAQMRSFADTLQDPQGGFGARSGFRPIENTRTPTSFAVNVPDYTPTPNQFIRLERVRRWSVEGYIQHPITESEKTNEDALVIALENPTTTGQYTQGSGTYQLGPTQIYQATGQTSAKRLQADPATIYTPGTIGTINYSQADYGRPK